MSRRERKLLRRKGKKHKPEKEEHHEKKEAPRTEKKKRNRFLEFYDKNYKKNMWITFILLALSIMVLIGTAVMTGDVIHRGITLKGGVTVTIPYEKPVEIKAFERDLQEELGGSITVRALSRTGLNIGLIIDATDVDPDTLIDAVESRLGDLSKISVETMGSALGESFFKQTLLAILIAFLLMAIVVFFAFKTLVPGMAVILSAVSDILMTVAALNIFNIKIETAGIAALLMLIGYSVDTDILLTTRVVKRKAGTVFDRVMWAMKTGLTMTATSFIAIFIGYFFTQSETLRQIMLILMIGLAFDLLNTWIQNVGVLRWYMESKSKKHAEETLHEYHGKEKEKKEKSEEKKEKKEGKDGKRKKGETKPEKKESKKDRSEEKKEKPQGHERKGHEHKAEAKTHDNKHDHKHEHKKHESSHKHTSHEHKEKSKTQEKGHEESEHKEHETIHTTEKKKD